MGSEGNQITFDPFTYTYVLMLLTSFLTLGGIAMLIVAWIYREKLVQGWKDALTWIVSSREALVERYRKVRYGLSWRLKQFSSDSVKVNSVQLLFTVCTGALFVAKVGILEDNEYLITYRAFLNTHTSISTVLIFMTLFGMVFPLFINIARERSKTLGELHRKGLARLFDAVSRANRTKSQRLAKCLEAIDKDGGWKAELTFVRVAKPNDQMAEIVTCIAAFFSGLLDDSVDGEGQVSVILARMGERYVSEFVAYSPPDKRPAVSIGDLAYDDVTFTKAMINRDIVIVSDVKRESKLTEDIRRFRPIEGSKNEGSMLCFPIQPTGGRAVPLVLSVHVSQVDFFSEMGKEPEKWKKVIARFEPLISIEWCLSETMGLTVFKEGSHYVEERS